jgi:hypothetical protein
MNEQQNKSFERFHCVLVENIWIQEHPDNRHWS